MVAASSRLCSSVAAMPGRMCQSPPDRWSRRVTMIRAARPSAKARDLSGSTKALTRSSPESRRAISLATAPRPERLASVAATRRLKAALVVAS
jgi:hypothetical protein